MARRPRIRARRFGAVLVNPRRRKKSRKAGKRRNPKAWRLGKGFVKKNSRRRKSRRHKKNPRKWRLGKGFLKNSRRRKRKFKFKKHRRRNGKKYGAKRFGFKAKKGAYLSNGKKRRGKKRRIKVKFKKHRRHYGRRRNPAKILGKLAGTTQKTLSRLTSPLARVAGKIPLVGSPLARSILIVPTVAFGALGGEIPLQASKGLAMIDSDMFPISFLKGLSEEQYVALIGVLSGGVLGGLVNKSVGLAVASGAVGAAWYTYRRKQALADAGTPDVVEELSASAGEGSTAGLGAVLLGGSSLGAVAVGGSSLGMGPAYTVGPQGYGAVVVGS